MNNYNKLFSIIRQTDLLNYDEKNELKLYLMNLNEQNKKQKEAINKVIKALEIQIEVIKEQPSDNAVSDNFEINQRNMCIKLLKEVSE